CRSRAQGGPVRHRAFSAPRCGGSLMLCKSRCTSFVASAAVSIVGLIGASPHAQALVLKPFNVTSGGTAEFVSVVPFVPPSHFALGLAPEMGRYYGVGQVQLLGFTEAATADFDSAVPFVFTAANGDNLDFTYATRATAPPARAK